MAHAWRSMLFGVEGWRHYMKSGYEARAKHFDDTCLRRDLTGTHVMVTGANAGIGYATSKALAVQKAHVHMVCRNKVRGEAALATLRAEVAELSGGVSDGANVSLHICDISSMAAVKALSDAYVLKGDPLHALINNAGCMVHERTSTPEGIEANFATNSLGTWALTEGLMPALKRTADARVVTVSSAGMLTEQLEVKDVEMKNGKFDGTRQYALNKRHQVALTQRWARLHGGESEGANDVGFYAMHPGWSDTDALKTALPGFYSSLKDKLRTPAQGADTVVWLSMAPKAVLKNGAFYLDRGVVPIHVSTSFLTGTQYKDEAVDRLASAMSERFNGVVSA
mmetsp:Transcript_42792/g.68846  ORF Transcript_42792/g.68846 Transcript_42792/m.68846 type:complete len:339 (+) Transcript_42792:68-1084(+)